MTDANAEAIRTEARQYLSVAKGLYKRKKFNNQAITNIICLSAEQCMVSFLIENDALPNHHSLDFLIDQTKKVKPEVPDALVADLHFMEEFQNLCVIESIGMKSATDHDVERLLNALTELDSVLFPST
ncbi:MAG TPA: hypothetical protein PLS12_11870 [Bacteroidales bacterium]|nr:hypothetical protein [Bacteroidales bacterium]